MFCHNRYQRSLYVDAIPTPTVVERRRFYLNCQGRFASKFSSHIFISIEWASLRLIFHTDAHEFANVNRTWMHQLHGVTPCHQGAGRYGELSPSGELLANSCSWLGSLDANVNGRRWKEASEKIAASCYVTYVFESVPCRCLRCCWREVLCDRRCVAMSWQF